MVRTESGRSREGWFLPQHRSSPAPCSFSVWKSFPLGTPKSDVGRLSCQEPCNTLPIGWDRLTKGSVEGWDYGDFFLPSGKMIVVGELHRTVMNGTFHPLISPSTDCLVLGTELVSRSAKMSDSWFLPGAQGLLCKVETETNL